MHNGPQNIQSEGRLLEVGSKEDCGEGESSEGTRGIEEEERIFPTRHELYGIWDAMKQRCRNPNCQIFKYYGGRGIKVCERWIQSFQNFLDDMGPRPAKGYQLDRIDNDGNYEPGNVRWVSNKVQSRNKRSNVFIPMPNGESMCVNDAAKILGISSRGLGQRVQAGLTGDALIAPPMRANITWSCFYESCTCCGTTTKRHASRGLCVSCYEKKNRIGRKPSKANNK